MENVQKFNERFKGQFHKMVKQTQIIRRQLELLSVFDHFVGLAIKGLSFDTF